MGAKTFSFVRAPGARVLPRHRSLSTGCSTGALYRVFDTIEDCYHYIYGSGLNVAERRTIEYREDSNRRFLIVRHQTRKEPDKPTATNRVAEAETCSAYQWSYSHFAFELDRANGGRFCSSAGRK